MKPTLSTTLTRSELLKLVESAHHLNAKLSLDELLRSLLKIACDLSNSVAGSVILHDSKRNELYFAAAIGPVAAELPSIRMPPGAGKAGKVFTTKTALIDNELLDDEKHYKTVDEMTQFTTRSLACVPLVHEGTAYGVMQILNKNKGRSPYKQKDVVILQHLADQAAIALRNSYLFQGLLASSGLYGSNEARGDILQRMTAQSVAARREFITVLFADMRGFTQLCSMPGMQDPEMIQRILSDYISMLSNVVLEYQGIVNKFLGDGLLAIFRGDKAAHNAVRAAFEMLSRFPKLREGWDHQTSHSLRFLDIGVGITSDHVVIGTIGSDDVKDFTVVGVPVVLAASLEREARGGKRVLCDRNTYRLAGDIIVEAEQGMHRLGKSDQTLGLDFDVFHLKQLSLKGGMPGVFVSYSSEDEERVLTLVVNPLKERGANVFFGDRDISPAKNFPDVIGQAIRDCDWFIVVASNYSVKSRWVRQELSFALDQTHLEDKILPVRLDAVDITQLSWRLNDRQYVDAASQGSGEKLSAAFEKIVARHEHEAS